jgi:hypothetical protein
MGTTQSTLVSLKTSRTRGVMPAAIIFMPFFLQWTMWETMMPRPLESI